MIDAGERQRFDLRFGEIRLIDPAQILGPKKRLKYSIKDVGIGGVLRFDKKTFRVTATSVYQETDDKFRREKQYIVTELALFCLETGETQYIEWEIDDQLEICFTTRELSAKELSYDNYEPVDFDDIDEMADEEETLILDNVTYDYDDDWSAKWRASDGRNSCVFMVDFGNAHIGWITIEGWSEDGDENGDWEYQAFHSINIAPTSIEILSLGEKGSADGRAV
jgi:hypothetical protein